MGMQQVTANLAFLLGNILVYIRFPRRIWRFRKRLGYFPNVCKPVTKNEKFLWRKTFDRNPMYRLLTDKIAVRTFIAMRCPDLLLSNIIWIGASTEEISEDLLQPGVVIKTNNGSSRNIFIRERPLDRGLINARIDAWLKTIYGARGGEWVYGLISPCVFIERIIAPEAGEEFVDISCHVVAGRCLLVTVDKDVKQPNERIAVYDAQRNRIKAYFRERVKAQQHLELPPDYDPPNTFYRAVEQAERIARDFDHIRVDFMSVGDNLYFCECTVFPMGGFSIIAAGADERIAAAWDLRSSWFLRHPQDGLKGLYARLYRRFASAN